MLITKAKCKRADSAELKQHTLNRYGCLLNIYCFEMPACT